MEARLDVYGDGPYRSQVEEEITRLGVGDRVTLHGRVPMDELPGLLAGADIALVPSLPEPYMHYSLSTKLLEAVAMGVPVIASDLATFRSQQNLHILLRQNDRQQSVLRRIAVEDVPDEAGASEHGS